jgi:hypothetical protein
LPELKSIKQEQFVRSYIKNKFNGSKAYKALHPNASDITCRSNSSSMLAEPEIQNRAKEILNQSNLSLDNILPTLAEEATSTKPFIIPTKANVIYIPDNATRLEAKKLLLKVHNVLNDHNVSTDARSIHINIDPARLSTMLDRLEALNTALDVTDTATVRDK